MSAFMVCTGNAHRMTCELSGESSGIMVLIVLLGFATFFIMVGIGLMIDKMFESQRKENKG